LDGKTKEKGVEDLGVLLGVKLIQNVITIYMSWNNELRKIIE